MPNEVVRYRLILASGKILDVDEYDELLGEDYFEYGNKNRVEVMYEYEQESGEVFRIGLPEWDEFDTAEMHFAGIEWEEIKENNDE